MGKDIVAAGAEDGITDAAFQRASGKVPVHPHMADPMALRRFKGLGKPVQVFTRQACHPINLPDLVRWADAGVI